MEDVDSTDEFLNYLFTYLTGKEPIQNEINIFRKHNNKLDNSGEISLPLNKSAWQKYIHNVEEIDVPILNFINRENKGTEICNNLLITSKNWNISIIKCAFEREKLNIFLDRSITFKNIISYILTQQKQYGWCNLSYKSKINIQIENDENNPLSADLTQLRITLLREVIKNLLKITGNDTVDSNLETILLTNKSQSKNEFKKVVCGVVISNKFGKKNTDITAQEYYNKRTIDMRLMAQHKYGVRVNSDSGWAEFFERLGTAAVAIDLLHVKPSRPIVINIESATCSHGKGASFILYNCARLSAILKAFDEKVSNGTYPPLPGIEDIEFHVLNQSEEWEILYVYLMQYPHIIKSCVRDIEDYKINIHNLCTFLESLCSLFSIYYRRVRILINPRIHLFPMLQARIYFLKAVQEVLHNALLLLNIPPVKQM